MSQVAYYFKKMFFLFIIRHYKTRLVVTSKFKLLDKLWRIRYITDEIIIQINIIEVW